MRPNGIVDLTAAFDQHPGLEQGGEHRAGQQFVPQLPVKALHVDVPPGRSWRDVERLYPNPFEPLSHPRCGEVRPVVAADVVGHALAHE